jgi:hypothetical protein
MTSATREKMVRSFINTSGRNDRSTGRMYGQGKWLQGLRQPWGPSFFIPDFRALKVNRSDNHPEGINAKIAEDKKSYPRINADGADYLRIKQNDEDLNAKDAKMVKKEKGVIHG